MEKKQEKRIDRETVMKVASLARLNITEEEAELFSSELASVLEAFSIIENANVEKKRPAFHPLPVKNILREDRPGKCLTQEEALSNTKNKENGYFKGPRTT